MICLSLGVGGGGVEGGGSYHFIPTAPLSLTNYSVSKIPQMRHQGFIEQIERLCKNKKTRTQNGRETAGSEGLETHQRV